MPTVIHLEITFKIEGLVIISIILMVEHNDLKGLLEPMTLLHPLLTSKGCHLFPTHLQHIKILKFSITCMWNVYERMSQMENSLKLLISSKPYKDIHPTVLFHCVLCWDTFQFKLSEEHLQRLRGKVFRLLTTSLMLMEEEWSTLEWSHCRGSHLKNNILGSMPLP